MKNILYRRVATVNALPIQSGKYTFVSITGTFEDREYTQNVGLDSWFVRNYVAWFQEIEITEEIEKLLPKI